MNRIPLAVLIGLAACQPAEPQGAVNETTQIPVDELGLPTRKPDGSPLTAAYCDTEEAARIYGNLKGCTMVACTQGDKESCEIAETFANSQAPEGEAASGSPSRKSVKLEGMDYIEARKVILSYGWKPLAGGCGGGVVDDYLCRKYPEIGNCSGTGLGFCDMTFIRPKRCLTIVTVGGSPDDRYGGEARIRSVTFTRAPCSKDPNEAAL